MKAGPACGSQLLVVLLDRSVDSLLMNQPYKTIQANQLRYYYMWCAVRRLSIAVAVFVALAGSVASASHHKGLGRVFIYILSICNEQFADDNMTRNEPFTAVECLAMLIHGRPYLGLAPPY